MANTFDRSAFVAGYLAEVEEHLEHASAQLLKIDVALREGQPQLRMIRELFRALHTIKGLSAMVDVEPVVAIAHEMEALFRVRDQTSSPLAVDAIELLLRALRAIDARVRAFAQGQPLEPAPAELLAAMRALTSDASPPTSLASTAIVLAPEILSKLAPSDCEQMAQGIDNGLTALRIDFAPSPERVTAGVSITSVRDRVSKLADIVKVVPQSVPKTPAAPTGLSFALLVLTRASHEDLARAAEVDPGAVTSVTMNRPPQTIDEPLDYLIEPAQHHDTIRVEVSRLDDALEKLSALVVGRSRIERAARAMREDGVDTRALELLLTEHRRDLARLRGALTQARMVPMKQLLERIPLLVRGMTRETGKQVELVLDAGRAELDKAVAERVFPALMHLIRNAIDHAIEAPDVRARLGKNAAGTISVRCFERAGNQLELSVIDDGAGIDRVRVAEKAKRPVPTDDEQLLQLIARPGLSTRDVANARSGRGMGMDIVRRVTVDILGGELSLHTVKDVGTTFTMRLPMSISILDAFSFRCGPQAFVVPLAAVDEIVELERAQLLQAPKVHDRRVSHYLRRHGENIPLFELASFFALEPQAGLRSVLLVQREGKRFGFSVDHMLGQQEVVVRPLEDPLVKVSGVTGSTDLGDGRPTLVLDLWALTRDHTRWNERHAQRGRA
jgi:two-component system, chemotaxis family, sensor kinase CheA